MLTSPVQEAHVHMRAAATGPRQGREKAEPGDGRWDSLTAVAKRTEPLIPVQTCSGVQEPRARGHVNPAKPCCRLHLGSTSLSSLPILVRWLGGLKKPDVARKPPLVHLWWKWKTQGSQREGAVAAFRSGGKGEAGSVFRKATFDA